MKNKMKNKMKSKIPLILLLSMSVSNSFVFTPFAKNSKITKLQNQRNSDPDLLIKDNQNSTKYVLIDTKIYNHNPSDTNSTKDSVDLIEKYSDWFGLFPKEQKWKSIRFTIYSISAGYCLSEGIHKLINLFSEQPLQDFFDR